MSNQEEEVNNAPTSSTISASFPPRMDNPQEQGHRFEEEEQENPYLVQSMPKQGQNARESDQNGPVESALSSSFEPSSFRHDTRTPSPSPHEIRRIMNFNADLISSAPKGKGNEAKTPKDSNERSFTINRLPNVTDEASARPDTSAIQVSTPREYNIPIEGSQSNVSIQESQVSNFTGNSERHLKEINDWCVVSGRTKSSAISVHSVNDVDISHQSAIQQQISRMNSLAVSTPKTAMEGVQSTADNEPAPAQASVGGALVPNRMRNMQADIERQFNLWKAKSPFHKESDFDPLNPNPSLSNRTNSNIGQDCNNPAQRDEPSIQQTQHRHDSVHRLSQCGDEMGEIQREKGNQDQGVTLRPVFTGPADHKSAGIALIPSESNISAKSNDFVQNPMKSCPKKRFCLSKKKFGGAE